jgi:UPF0755 protein
MKKVIACILIIFVILTAGAAGYIYFSYNSFLDKPASTASTASEQVEFTIKSGQLSSSIISELYGNGLLTNKLYAKIYVNQENLGTGLKAGLYNLDKSMTPKEIFQKLTAGGEDTDQVRVTIPEGYTTKQIAEVLLKDGFIKSTDEFIKECNSGSFDYDFVKNIPEGRQYRLEGYLFPDTYQFKDSATSHDIIDAMLKRFQKISESLPDPSGKADGRSLDEIVNMASIIQGEGAVESELPIISSVFYNRLGTGMLLQSCATVQYALGERKTSLTIEDTKVDSPYNTYVHEGLPVGPVGNPGLTCLKAACQPSEDDYFYFVTKEDGTKEHYFAKTYQEHLANIEKSKKN